MKTGIVARRHALEETEETRITPQIDRFHEIELNNLSEAMLKIHELRIQVFIFFATVDVGALSVAFNTQKASVVFVGGIFLCLGVVFDLVQLGVFIRFLSRALILEAQFSPADKDTYLSLFFHTELIEKMRKTIDEPDGGERIKKITSLSRRTLLRSTFWLPGTVALAQFALALIMWSSGMWTLF
jgi:hypothetical protein